MTISVQAANHIAELLIKRQETITIAESSIGGLLSASLLAVPGASKFYLGGSILYTLEARSRLLNIPQEKINSQKPLSESYATLLADGMRHLLGSTWAICEIGATGPGKTPYGHAAGICVFAISGPEVRTKVFKTQSSDREKNMQLFNDEALSFFTEVLEEAKPKFSK